MATIDTKFLFATSAFTLGALATWLDHGSAGYLLVGAILLTCKPSEFRRAVRAREIWMGLAGIAVFVGVALGYAHLVSPATRDVIDRTTDHGAFVLGWWLLGLYLLLHLRSTESKANRTNSG